MKRFLAVVLTSCMIVGLASPAGSGVMTEIRANTDAALTTLSAPERRTENSTEGTGSFEQSISELYDNSMTATDEEVLASAQKMDSDFAAVETIMGENAGDLIDYLKYYEAAKSNYIAGVNKEEDGFSGDVIGEWERQGEYTSYVMPATDTVYTMVPRIKVNECSVSDGSADLDIYEWMTVGYAPDSSSRINATAYGYTFSLKLDRDRSGNWQVASIEDTDANFDWMEEEAAYSLQAQQESEDAFRVFSEDGGQEMMAASAAKSYTYNVSNAIAYADKYCINYNSAYTSYKGRGGDCANFVSQCLYNGGFPQDSVWYKNSVAWINVMKQIAHFKQYGTFMNANNGNILKGNPIYFDWNGDSTYDHATICVGRNNSGTAILDSHTRDLYHATWNNWSFSKAATIQLRGSGTAASTSSEGGSFKSNSKGIWYEYGDGTYLTSCFKTIDGKRYYFASSGYALKGLQKISGSYYYFDTSTYEMKTGWIYYNKQWYYFGTDGTAYTEWEYINGKWYYFDPTTCVMATGFCEIKGKLHYFGTNGAERFGWVYVSGDYYYLDQYGVVQFGWQTIDGKKYYFDPSGIMVTGIVNIDGVIHSFDDYGHYIGKSSATWAPTIIDTTKKSSITLMSSDQTGWVKSNSKWYYVSNGSACTGWIKYKEKSYYLGDNGAMATGWRKISGEWYYFGTDGAMKTGWVKTGGEWYYLQANGVMKTGWLKDNGEWYYLQANGVMKLGWLQDNGEWYFLQANGIMKIGWLQLGNKWYFLQANGMMKTGWLRLGNKWYYLNSNGVMKTGWHYDSNGKTYYLASNGVMVTGRSVINGKTYYFDYTGALKD